MVVLGEIECADGANSVVMAAEAFAASAFWYAAFDASAALRCASPKV